MSTKLRVVLTGASGTLGSHILQLLQLEPDVEILSLHRKESRVTITGANVTHLAVDFFNEGAVREVIAPFRPTCVIHCAATGMEFPRPEWFSLIRFNVDVSITLCECASRSPGCHFIYISTGLVYREQGRPLVEDDPIDTCHPYGASKAAADILVRSAAAEFGVPLTVLRPFSFTGARDDRKRLFSALLKAAADGNEFQLSAGEQVRDHCSAGDIARAACLAMHRRADADAEVFNVGSGDQTPLRDLIEGVVADLNLSVRLRFGARPYHRFEPMHLVANTERARHVLEWVPQINLSYAVWELAQSCFPTLELRRPIPTR